MKTVKTFAYSKIYHLLNVKFVYRGNITGVILLKLYLQTSTTVNSGKLQDTGSTTVKICSLLRSRRKLLPLSQWIVQDIGLYSQLKSSCFILLLFWGWGGGEGWQEINGVWIHVIMYVYNSLLSNWCVQIAPLTVSQSRPNAGPGRKIFQLVCTKWTRFVHATGSLYHY